MLSGGDGDRRRADGTLLLSHNPHSVNCIAKLPLMSDAPPSGIALLAGPQLLGFFFDWALQGVLSVQIYFYYLLFPEDPLPTKILVYGTFVYEWVQTALITQTAFDIDVYQFGDRVSLTTYHNTWFSVTIMCAVISAVVQGYFAWRIYKFSCSGILAGVIIFLAFGQMCAGITGGILLKVMHSGAAAPSSSIITPVFTTWLTTAATVDVLIAVCMTYLLLRSKSGIRRSDAVVNRMVRLCIETGTLTASVAILNAVFFALPSQTLLYQCP
ncbi:hypothetical protein C8Q77DRAFT_222015 [Trametes polyzona]|nr:hypothetical protein C8Q77DRAFT_222015 [Trametes polyzona]